MSRTSIINCAALWDRLSTFARKAGRMSTRPMLLLYYVMKSKDTPKKDKLLIFSTLSYLILPINILDAKRLPIMGWLDEVTSLAVLVQKMSKCITPEMQGKADTQLDKWFPEYAKYEMIEGQDELRKAFI